MSKQTQRNYILGSDWIYYKVYTGPKTSDTILKEIIGPIAKKLKEAKTIDKWFFIRYSDPKYHLRIRFNHKNPNDVGAIINSLYPHFKKFVDQDLIWKIQIDTYQREIERYGINTIELAEDLFYHDSKMIVDCITRINGNEELRWLFSLKAIDSLLNSFEYTASEKLDLLERLKTNFGNEFGMARPLKKQLDDRFRIERKKIDEFMSSGNGQGEHASISNLLLDKQRNIEHVVQGILKYKKSKDLPMGMDNLIASYSHMLMNRLFKSKNRLHEMVCYDFLYRYYKSKIARIHFQKSKNSLS